MLTGRAYNMPPLPTLYLYTKGCSCFVLVPPAAIRTNHERTRNETGTNNLFILNLLKTLNKLYRFDTISKMMLG